jgi:sugar phosphate isomerase/epimerase
MSHDLSMNRRRFLNAGLASSAVLAASPFAALRAADDPDPYRGLKMGVASYSLRKFTLDEAIGMTRELGLKYICLKDVHLSLKSTKEQRQDARKKIDAAGLVLLGCGVVYIRNVAEEIKNVFEYAKDAGMPTIVCSPHPDALDKVEALAKETNIRIAIHNHGPTDKLYPAPQDALKLVKDRDERLGLCIDLGHTVRIGKDPVEAIQECGKRLYDFHMKDVSAGTAQGKEVVVGTGVIDIPAVLKALLEVKFAGHLGLEHEPSPENPLPGMKESLAYLRKSLAKLS